MKVIIFIFFIIDNTIEKSPDHPGSNEPGPSGAPAKASNPVTPDSDKRENVKRRLDSEGSLDAPAKKSNINQQSSTTTGGSNLQENPIRLATPISRPIQSTQAQENINQVDQQQIQTAKGNDHNERGSLVGEAGNRKVQKPAGKHFGEIQVNSNMSRTLVFAFAAESIAKEFVQLVDILYGHTKLQLTTFKLELFDNNKFGHLYFWVVLKLGFNMGYESMIKKFGLPLTKTKYVLIRNIPENIEEDEQSIIHLKEILQILFTNRAGLTTMEELLEAEKKQKEYRENASTSKKRKLNFD